MKVLFKTRLFKPSLFETGDFRGVFIPPYIPPVIILPYSEVVSWTGETTNRISWTGKGTVVQLQWIGKTATTVAWT